MWLWMGAAISIAEILTGAMLASLGVTEGLLANFIGRTIGVIFLMLVGHIGASTRMNAMESVGVSFGTQGYKLFSLLNVLQLIGWTAVMISSGGAAITLFLQESGSSLVMVLGDSLTMWNSIAIGALIFIWLILRAHSFMTLNNITVGALTLCCAFITYRVIGIGLGTDSLMGAGIMSASAIAERVSTFEPMSFGLALELSLAMPLSWVPLIADYNKEAENPVKANFWGALIYGVGGFWMSSVGLLAANYTGFTDVSALMAYMGLGVIAFFVIALSTVTTTYLDVKSAAISYGTIMNAPTERVTSIVVIIVGVVLAIQFDSATYMDFLYYIGSCFAPMAAIMITDYFLLGHKKTNQVINVTNTILWVSGLCFYRYLINLSIEGFDPTIGISIPVLVVVMAVTYVVGKVRNR